MIGGRPVRGGSEAKTEAASSFTCRHPELVSGSTSPMTESALVAAWMLKRVQHDAT